MYSKGFDLQSKKSMRRNMAVNSSRIASEYILFVRARALISLYFSLLIAPDGDFDVR